MAGMSPWGDFPQGSAEETAVVEAFSRVGRVVFGDDVDERSSGGLVTLEGSFTEAVQESLRALKRRLSWLPFVHVDDKTPTSD